MVYCSLGSLYIRRNSVGEQPLALRKARLKVVRLAKPDCMATSVIGMVESAIRRSAAFIRLPFMYWIKDIPLCSLNIREK